MQEIEEINRKKNGFIALLTGLSHMLNFAKIISVILQNKGKGKRRI